MMSAGGEAGLGWGRGVRGQIRSARSSAGAEAGDWAGAGGGRSGVAGSGVTGATAGQRPPNKYPPDTRPGLASSAEYRDRVLPPSTT